MGRLPREQADNRVIDDAIGELVSAKESNVAAAINVGTLRGVHAAEARRRVEWAIRALQELLR